MPGDGDLYWQRWLGELILQTHRLPSALGTETFTAAGATWVPQEWLFGILVALAWNAHVFFWFSLAFSALPAMILATIYRRARGRASAEAIGVALLFCGLALLTSFGVRAQVLGWTMLAFFMLFLERNDRWYYLTIPTAVLWANLHASVAIAPVIVVCRIVATIADGGLRGLRTSRDLIALPAVVLATFCTPLGWKLPAFALALSTSPIRAYIQEWQPPDWRDGSFVLGLLPIALAVLLGGRTTLIRAKMQSFPALVLFVAALVAARNMAIFAIVAAPLAAVGLDARFPKIRAIGSKARELEPVALATIGFVLALSAIALARQQLNEPARLPIAAIASLAADQDAHRVLCEDFTWCSIALQYPALRVFIDGRCDAYPLAVWRQYVSTVGAHGSWAQPLQAYGVDSVVARRGGRLALALAKAPRWEPAYRDDTYVVFRHD